jgi:hypothetical protein
MSPRTKYHSNNWTSTSRSVNISARLEIVSTLQMGVQYEIRSERATDIGNVAFVCGTMSRHVDRIEIQTWSRRCIIGRHPIIKAEYISFVHDL